MGKTKPFRHIVWDKTSVSDLGAIKMKFSIVLEQPLISLTTVMRNGRHQFYKEITSRNLADCFQSENVENTVWYVDAYGNLRKELTCAGITYDTVYRSIKKNVSKKTLARMYDRIGRDQCTNTLLCICTDTVGLYIANIMGWKIRGWDNPKYRVS